MRAVKPYVLDKKHTAIMTGDPLTRRQYRNIDAMTDRNTGHRIHRHRIHTVGPLGHIPSVKTFSERKSNILIYYN